MLFRSGPLGLVPTTIPIIIVTSRIAAMTPIMIIRDFLFLNNAATDAPKEEFEVLAFFSLIFISLSLSAAALSATSERSDSDFEGSDIAAALIAVADVSEVFERDLFVEVSAFSELSELSALTELLVSSFAAIFSLFAEVTVLAVFSEESALLAAFGFSEVVFFAVCFSTAEEALFVAVLDAVSDFSLVSDFAFAVVLATDAVFSVAADFAVVSFVVFFWAGFGGEQ